MINIIMILLAVFFLSVIGVVFFRKIAPAFGLIDIPNARSSHTTPKQRGGGVVFIIIWLAALTTLFFFHKLSAIEWFGLFFPTILVSLIGFIDDLKGLSVIIRFFSYFIAAIILLFATFKFNSNSSQVFQLFIAGLIIFYVAWSVNLYNFMDGIDGISGVEAIFILGFACFAFYQVQAVGLVLANAILITAILGFLVFNWPPSKLFMGDVGSAGLGCIVACLTVIACRLYHLPLIPWLIIYGLFLFDTAVTLARRVYAGEKWYQAHKSHAYQRFVQSGKTHLHALLGCIFINGMLVAFAVCAFLVPKLSWLFICLTLLLLSTAYIYVECKFPFKNK